MASQKFRRRLSQLIRRYPLIIRIPYTIWRVIQPKYTLGVVGILFNEQGQVLLVEHVFHHRAWGLPGGWVGRNEHPADAVQRELSEELQLNVDPYLIVLTKVSHPNHLDTAYLCRTEGTIGVLSDELLGYKWQNIDALPYLYDFHYSAIMRAHEIISGKPPCHQV